MPVTRQGDTTIMTPETVQAMIDQALHRNSTDTHDKGSQNSGGGPRRPVQPAHVCSYTDFMKCQPLNFKRTEGVVGLSRWFERWNQYSTSAEILKKKLTDKYCPKGEIKKLEIELWNLKAKGNDIGAENKRKLNDNNQAQQQLLKKQNVVQAYVVGSGEKKLYGGFKPLCPKCNYHHDGECAPKCTNYKKVGHLTKDCWHPINANNQRTITCYECGNQRHYRSDCPVLKNQCTEARGMMYVLEGGKTDQDINNMEDDINA
ncbi:reverse transcriptase domain-containing protein [Tanacetum coccineum]|uniref:Reverse transcriptase domain-containing protein n=1 Tax=Tanacetum coccineum TaxID=301880 RepID=A0ABQ5B1M6_9ASTR